MKEIEIIKKNNEKIEELKEIIRKNYNDNTDDIKTIDIENVNSNYEEIINKQREDINKLNILIDIKGQSVTIEMRKKIEKLKERELDKDFSNFYRNGFINVKGRDVSVEKFYIKEFEKDGKTVFIPVCADDNVEKELFTPFNEEGYELKKIYKFKKSRIFYEIYLDKSLYVNNKIIIDSQDKIDKFNKYISNWTPENHKMVAETMIDYID